MIDRSRPLRVEVRHLHDDEAALRAGRALGGAAPDR